MQLTTLVDGETFFTKPGSLHDCDSPTDPLTQRFREIETFTESVMTSWGCENSLLCGRKSHRAQYRAKFIVTPIVEESVAQILLADESIETNGDSQLVQGWDISQSGISFLHNEPLPSRVIAATFLRVNRTLETVLVRLQWCRFTRQLVYRSGGNFLKKLDSSFASKIDLAQFESDAQHVDARDAG